MLAFATAHDVDVTDIPTKKQRAARISSQDPMSHRIIEKRRRDRMNNCLADLSHLIPSTYLKQGQGRIEKTEIIEMATRHIKQLQALAMETAKVPVENGQCCVTQYMTGFNECMDEVRRFLVEETNFSAVSPLCVDLMGHLKDVGQSLCQRATSMQNMRNMMEIDGDTKEMTTRMMETGHSYNAKRSSRPSLPDVAMSNGAQISSREEATDVKALPVDNLGEEMMNPAVKMRESGLAYQQCGSTAYQPTSSDVNETHSSGVSPRNATSQCLLACLLPERRQDSSLSELEQSARPRDLSSNSSVSSRDSDSSKSSSSASYKFKNHIKRRFTATMGGKDSGMCSAEFDLDDNKMRVGQLCASDSSRSDCTSSFSSPSDCSSNNSSPQRSMKQGPEQIGAAHYEDVNGSVPGFALHPTGTYYVPVVMAMPHVLPYFQSEPANNAVGGICHPISIPVIFTGPVISQPTSPRSAPSTFNSGFRNNFASCSEFTVSAAQLRNQVKPFHI